MCACSAHLLTSPEAKLKQKRKTKPQQHSASLLLFLNGKKKVLYALSTNFKSRIIIDCHKEEENTNTFSTKYKYNVSNQSVALY